MGVQEEINALVYDNDLLDRLHRRADLPDTLRTFLIKDAEESVVIPQIAICSPHV